MDQTLRVRIVGDGDQFKVVVDRASTDLTKLDAAARRTGQSVQRSLGDSAATGVADLSKTIQRARADIGGLVALGGLQRLTGEVSGFGDVVEAVFAGRVVVSIGEYAKSMFQAAVAANVERQASLAAAAAATLHHKELMSVYTSLVAAGGASTAYAASLRQEIAASTAATLAARQKAASTTVLGTAMRALGGPWGLVMIAATALSFWAITARSARSESEKLAEAAKKAGDGTGKATAQSLAEQAYALEQVQALYVTGAEGLSAEGRAVMDRLLADNKAKVAALLAQIEDIRKREGRISEIADGGRRAEADAERKREEDRRKRERALEDEIKDRERLMDEGRRLTEGTRTDYETLAATTERYAFLLGKGAISQETFNRLVEEAGDKYYGTAEKLERFRTLTGKIFPEQAAVQQYLADYRLLAEYLDGPELQRAVTALHENILKGQADASTGAKTVADQTAEVWRSAAGSIRESFRDTFRGILDDGLKSFDDLGDRLIGNFKDIIAELATIRFANPIILPMVGGIGSMMGVSNTAQASVLNQLGVPVGGSAGTDALMAAFGGSAGRGLGLGLIGGSFGANFSYALPSLLGGGGAGFGAVTSAFQAGGMAGGFGAVAGAALPWVAGALALDSITGGSLFGTSWKANASGYELSLADGDIGGVQFLDEKKKRRMFGGTRRRTTYSDIDPAFLASLNSTLDAGIDQILAGAAGLGQSAAQQILDGFSSEVRLDLHGKSQDEAQAAVEEWVGKMFSSMARAVLADTRFAGLLNDVTQETISAVLGIGTYLGADPVSDAAEIARLSSRTLKEQYDEQRTALLELVRAYDGSESATQRLATATAERYQTELALLAQISAVRINVQDVIGGSIESIRQSVMNPQQLYAHLTGRAETLAGDLLGATDPALIQQLVGQIDALTNQAYGLLGQGSQGIYAPEFIEFLEGVQGTAEQRLALAERGVQDLHIETANIVRDSMAAASDRLIRAAEALEAAAAAQEEQWTWSARRGYSS